MKEYQELLPPLPEDQYDLLMKTIKEEGQHDPITVNSNGVVCTTDSGGARNYIVFSLNDNTFVL